MQVFFNKLKGSKWCSLSRFWRNLTKKDCEKYGIKFCLLSLQFLGVFWGSESGFSGSDPDFLTDPDPDSGKKVWSGSGQNHPYPKHWTRKAPDIRPNDLEFFPIRPDDDLDFFISGRMILNPAVHILLLKNAVVMILTANLTFFVYYLIFCSCSDAFVLGGSPGVVVMGGDSCLRRSWVQIPALYTGWTFLTFICCQDCNVCLKLRK